MTSSSPDFHSSYTDTVRGEIIFLCLRQNLRKIDTRQRHADDPVRALLAARVAHDAPHHRTGSEEEVDAEEKDHGIVHRVRDHRFVLAEAGGAAARGLRRCEAAGKHDHRDAHERGDERFLMSSVITELNCSARDMIGTIKRKVKAESG